ncbi:esterase/lipase family protein [Cardinium endosymbiont of Nabis limbatus]|uniref:esterase/lipase family protein n=1 Tax=Cardinium endosymbiont of Nabis limbatus TaxID=3066217 RepID=UPI003AF394F3
MYRSIVLFCFALSVGCEGCNDLNKEDKESSALTPRPSLSESQVLLKKSNAKQSGNHPEETIESDGIGDLEAPKKVENAQRVAKVPEHKQAVVLLHGLARISSDFACMIKAFKKMFPYATIIALKCLNKDSNKGKFSSPSSKLSIKEQAKEAYEEIKSAVPYGSHLVLVGHSQGGLRAFSLIKEYGSDLKNEYGIVIDHLITIATPWKGAPIFDHINDVKKFNQKFGEIEEDLNAIQAGYADAVRGYFFKKFPNLAENHPTLYKNLALVAMKVSEVMRMLRDIKWISTQGVLDLNPKSDFISHYVASGLKEIDVPITAIAGVLTDFSKLFESFPFFIEGPRLQKLNATYAELIGGDPNCAHDMLLPVDTQHAVGLAPKNFKCITVEGACHGNKVGFSVKRGLSELNNKEVIQKVVESIEETFYEQKEKEGIEKGAEAPLAA